MSRLFLVIAALLLAVATALGAYASHSLGSVLEPRALATFETGVDYQFYHALGLFGLAVLIDRYPGSRGLAIAASLVALGTTLFCAGVYASSLAGPGWLRSLAPTGGTVLILGWLVAAWAGWQLGRRAAPSGK
jgi:uncharacterized membrane protein YgdD (TMEM256/DUF423 family)